MKKYLSIFLVICGFSATAQTKNDFDKFTQIEDSLKRIGKEAEIIPFFLKQLKSQPKNEQFLRQVAHAYLKNNQFEISEKYYKEALVINPKCGNCYINMGIMYGQKDTKKAGEYFDKAVKAEPTKANLYIIRAEFRAMSDNNIGALEDYNKAVEVEPTNIYTYLKRGSYHARQNSTNWALADLNKAIELDPKDAENYFQRGYVYYTQKMFKEALADANTAIKLDDKRELFYEFRGSMYTELELYNKAIEDYTTAIKINPNNEKLYYKRSLGKYKLEDMDGSCEDTQAAYTLMKKNDPDNSLLETLAFTIDNICDSTKASYYYQRGIAFFNIQKFKESANIYALGLKKFPNNAMMLSFSGNTYYNMGEYDKAIVNYTASIKNKANMIDDIKTNQKRTNIKDEELNENVNEFNTDTQMSIAKAQFALGQHSLALATINEAMKNLPNPKNFGKEEYYNIRGNIFMGLNKYQQAVADFDKCIQINPSFSLAYVSRAISRINIETKINMTYTVGGSSGTSLIPNWLFPVKTVVKKSNANLIFALADCDRAIEIAPKMGFAHYVRGHIKKMLAKTDYCYDFVRAETLNFPVEMKLLRECK